MAALLSVRNIEDMSTGKPRTGNIDGYYLVEAALLVLRTDRKTTTLDVRRVWKTRNTFGNNSTLAALLGVRNVEGQSTRKPGAREMDWNYLTDATSVGLRTVVKATTLELRGKWCAWYISGNNLIVTALLSVRNIEGLSTK